MFNGFVSDFDNYLIYGGLIDNIVLCIDNYMIIYFLKIIL